MESITSSLIKVTPEIRKIFLSLINVPITDLPFDHPKSNETETIKAIQSVLTSKEFWLYRLTHDYNVTLANTTNPEEVLNTYIILYSSDFTKSKTEVLLKTIKLDYQQLGSVLISRGAVTKDNLHIIISNISVNNSWIIDSLINVENKSFIQSSVISNIIISLLKKNSVFGNELLSSKFQNLFRSIFEYMSSDDQYKVISRIIINLVNRSIKSSEKSNEQQSELELQIDIFINLIVPPANFVVKILELNFNNVESGNSIIDILYKYIDIDDTMELAINHNNKTVILQIMKSREWNRYPNRQDQWKSRIPFN